MEFSDLSIIIPLGPKEQSWRQLVSDLKPLAAGAEVILVYPEGDRDFMEAAEVFVTYPDMRWVSAAKGRALQLNAGAAAASRSILWFLHADSRLDGSTSMGLRETLSNLEEYIYYFRLRFLADGPPLMPINEWGAWLRSRLLHMPFGDQGLLMRKSVFMATKGYPTDVAYGEDHCFVWQAARLGYPCRPVRGSLWTSARKYREQGWLRTTLRHQALTYKQALPEWWKTWRYRVKPTSP